MKKDLVDYKYLSDNLRYADLFNGVLFGGEVVLAPERLKGEDTKLVIAGENGEKGRYRDVVRKYESDVSYTVLGIENQESVDYSMPFRIMEYETGEYSRQIAKIRRKNRRLRHTKGAEYLCQFKRTDKIQPCVTLVLYWGDTWNGPEDLKDMMNLEGVPEQLKPYVNNYSMHLVQVRKIEDTSVFQTDLKLVFDFMKCAEDANQMRALLEENEKYKSVPRDAYEVMRVHTELKELDELMEACGEEEETVDMCKAIKEMLEEGREEGREVGRAEGRVEGMAQGLEFGLKGLVNTIKVFCNDFELLYNAVIKNEGYENITREQVMKYYI